MHWIVFIFEVLICTFFVSRLVDFSTLSIITNAGQLPRLLLYFLFSEKLPIFELKICCCAFLETKVASFLFRTLDSFLGQNR